MSLPQIINIPEMFKEFFARKNLTAANHLYPSQIISISEKSGDFFAGKNVLAANHLYLAIFQGRFHPQNCLNRKSSKPRKSSTTFLPGKWLCLKASIARE